MASYKDHGAGAINVSRLILEYLQQFFESPTKIPKDSLFSCSFWTWFLFFVVLFWVFPHPGCYIQVVNINFGWMSTNVSQVKPHYKDTKWLKSVPCQTEHVSIYVSIWRSVRQCRCRYRANNKLWPLETNFFTYLMMKPWHILGTDWHIDQFLEDHFGKRPYFQKLSALTSQEPFNVKCSGHDLWTKKVLQIPGCTPDFSWEWHLDTLTPWSPAFWYHDIAIEMGSTGPWVLIPQSLPQVKWKTDDVAETV